MKLAIIQNTYSANVEENLKKNKASIESAAKEGAELVLLPELHDSPYFCQTENVDAFDLAAEIPSERSNFYSEIARSNNIVLVCSLFEKRAAGLYHNTALVFERDGRLLSRYRKMHIPDDPGYYEKFYFTPGDLGFEPVQTSVGKLGVLVCWDQWYPEAARLMALAGAEILLYPTAIGFDPQDDKDEKKRQRDSWQIIQRAHAVANGIPVAVANRTGFEAAPAESSSPGSDFWGSSFICGPQGEWLASASEEKEEILYAEWDKKRSEAVRRIWPFLRDRRIDAYGDLTRRYRDEI